MKSLSRREGFRVGADTMLKHVCSTKFHIRIIPTTQPYTLFRSRLIASPGLGAIANASSTRSTGLHSTVSEYPSECNRWMVCRTAPGEPSKICRTASPGAVSSELGLAGSGQVGASVSALGCEPESGEIVCWIVSIFVFMVFLELFNTSRKTKKNLAPLTCQKSGGLRS